MNNLNELVLTNTLKKQLNIFITDAKKIPPFTVLYGEPGTGKTSFGKFFGESFSNDYQYFASNETFGVSEFEDIKNYLRSRSLFKENEGGLDKVIVIDEFHNTSKKQQERFKTLYDNLDETMRIIFILNTNSSSKGYKQLTDILSPAMISRCYPLCFDISLDEVQEVVQASKKTYENLDEETILKKLPDHRILSRLNQMASLNS